MEYKDTTFQVLETETHTCVITPGGLLVIETDKLDLEEGLSVEDIAMHDNILTVSIEEALKIASVALSATSMRLKPKLG